MSDASSSDPMLKRLRKLAGNGYEWLHDVADRLEQLQMPHAQVIRLAEVSDGGADSAALMKALCAKVEAQRRRIAQMERDHREDTRTAAAEERRSITTGEPYGTY